MKYLRYWISQLAKIQCSNCDAIDTIINGTDKDFRKKGWKATKDYCYCPKCSKLKLKK